MRPTPPCLAHAKAAPRRGRALRLWRSLIGLLLGMAWGWAQAQAVLEVPGAAQSVSLDAHLEYFIDTTERWRPESGEPAPGPWLALRERPKGSNFGFTPHPIWFRVALRSAQTQARVWVVSMAQLDRVEWVANTPGRSPQGALAGLGPIQAARVAPHRLPEFTLALQAGQTTVVHLRIQTSGLARVPMALWEPQAWHEEERLSLLVLGAFFGLIGGLLAYNGFLWLRLRDGAYGHYLGFGLALGTYQLCSSGVGPNLLWTEHALTSYTTMSLSAPLMGVTSALFAVSFLRVQRFSGTLLWLLRGFAAFWLLVLLAHLWLPVPWLVEHVLFPLGPLFALLLLVSGALGWRHGMPAAGYYLLSWSGLLLAITLRTLMAAGLLPPLLLLRSSLQVATAAEMLLLSLALADRIAVERRARADADLQRVREQAAREKAQHALEEKSRFMAAITHDLQQPLYALSLATESAARQGSGRLPAKTLDQMRSALFSADELLASLAMNVRLDRENLLPEFEVFSVQDMLERIDTLFASRAQQVGLRWRVPPSLSRVHSDPVMLERMVCNLVSNAMRYTQRGGVLLSCRARPAHLLIQVWDTGPGISEPERAAIFEAYRRGSAARSHDQGLGLGLSIVSRCASLLGIRVEVRSVPGRGSCFALWVPLADGQR